MRRGRRLRGRRLRRSRKSYRRHRPVRRHRRRGRRVIGKRRLARSRLIQKYSYKLGIVPQQRASNDPPTATFPPNYMLPVSSTSLETQGFSGYVYGMCFPYYKGVTAPRNCGDANFSHNSGFPPGEVFPANARAPATLPTVYEDPQFQLDCAQYREFRIRRVFIKVKPVWNDSKVNIKDMTWRLTAQPFEQNTAGGFTDGTGTINTIFPTAPGVNQIVGYDSGQRISAGIRALPPLIHVTHGGMISRVCTFKTYHPPLWTLWSRVFPWSAPTAPSSAAPNQQGISGLSDMNFPASTGAGTSGYPAYMDMYHQTTVPNNTTGNPFFRYTMGRDTGGGVRQSDRGAWRGFKQTIKFGKHPWQLVDQWNQGYGGQGLAAIGAPQNVEDIWSGSRFTPAMTKGSVFMLPAVPTSPLDGTLSISSTIVTYTATVRYEVEFRGWRRPQLLTSFGPNPSSALIQTGVTASNVYGTWDFINPGVTGEGVDGNVRVDPAVPLDEPEEDDDSVWDDDADSVATLGDDDVDDVPDGAA